MAFFGKLFSGRGGDSYNDGLALFEQGRAAEAIPLLRAVFQKDPGTPRGSLAGYYLRLALVSEGRRLLQTGDRDPAAAHLQEAAENWPEFPDLQFLCGVAYGLADRWGAALEASRQALRANADYCEARLLEACSLQLLERSNEAAESLNHLVESGRRVDHALVRDFSEIEKYTTGNVPDDLLVRLRRLALGDDAKHRLTEAVALCRAGKWDDGLAEFRQLGQQYPRYPDIRARHAAALYQVGQSAEALIEADAALALNDRYRTAVCLKGLILAEQGDILAAHRFLADATPRLEGTAGRHEELFLAYLRAVLALLLGEYDECRSLLSSWQDLPRQFARAELLLIACDDFNGWTDGALRRADDLCELWNADVDLHFIRLTLLLRQGLWARAESVLQQWPGPLEEPSDQRPLFLRARLDVAQGRVPTLLQDDAGTETSVIHHDAWRQLAIHAGLLTGDPVTALDLARAQLTAGAADEETGRLLLEAAARTGDKPPADMAGRIGASDSWGPILCQQLRGQGFGTQAEALVVQRRQTRPDLTQWSWLEAGFWLSPIRRWLA